MKISAVYKITNTVINDFYIGSSKDVKRRWAAHKCPSTWNDNPNSKLYKDMQKYGVDKFDFQILVNIEPEQLKEKEQEFIEKLKPTYNNYRAKGLDIERKRKHQKEFYQSERGKEWLERYEQSEKRKKYIKKYKQSEKYKKIQKKSGKKYRSQLCSYNGEILTLDALRHRFYRAGIENPTLEAKKYLLDKDL